MTKANQNTSFDEIPEQYDKYRPTYPKDLISEIIQTSGVDLDSSILEIGAGTGHATKEFLERELSVLAVEPGANFCAFMEDKFSKFSKFNVINSTLESAKLSENSFDLIYAAQSIHWVREDLRYKLPWTLLKDGKYLATFGHAKGDLDSEIRAKIDSIYNKYNPTSFDGAEYSKLRDQNSKDSLNEIKNSGFYESVEQKQYNWKTSYSSEEYINLIDTYSENRTLEDNSKKLLYSEFKDLIVSLGDKIEVPYITTLRLARKAS